MIFIDLLRFFIEIGIEYGQLENSWNANYNAVKAFFDEHHHLPVQDASILLPSGIQSRNWITNQKKFLKAGTVPEDTGGQREASERNWNFCRSRCTETI